MKEKEGGRVIEVIADMKVVEETNIREIEKNILEIEKETLLRDMRTDHRDLQKKQNIEAGLIKPETEIKSLNYTLLSDNRYLI